YSLDFPVTKTAYQTTPSNSRTGSGFLAKIKSVGSLGYATYFATPESTPKALVVDSTGSAYITGQSTGGLPATPGAYQTNCNCGFQSNGFFGVPFWDVFVARFDPEGSKLIYATYLGAVGSIGTTLGTSIAIAEDGSAYVGASSGVYWMNAAGSARLARGLPK